MRLIALLDLSETRPLSALADSLKSIGLADTHFSKAQNRNSALGYRHMNNPKRVGV